MEIEPSFEEFKDAFEQNRSQVVWTNVVADCETAVSAFLKLAYGEGSAENPERNPHAILLESVEGGEVRGRYSVIALDPDLLWQHDSALDGSAATQLVHKPLSSQPQTVDCPIAAQKGPLASFDALIDQCKIDLPPILPQMASGLFGYMGYDMVRQMERIPNANPRHLNVPNSLFMRPTLVVVFDRLKDLATIVTPVFADDGTQPNHYPASAYDAAVGRLKNAISRLNQALKPFDNALTSDAPAIPEPVSNLPTGHFQRLVERAKEYIFAGDIFQVVLSQRFTAPFELPPFALYRALRRVNPSPYLFFLDCGKFQVTGSSPEVLVSVSADREVNIRPIAGTRKRGATAEEDRALADDLLADPKELAEHLMLLDLGRNDVGRVSKVGSVSVKKEEEFQIELYSHVMHIVSNVTGTLRDDVEITEALAAGFPAGTVSGAPKVRAMEIIDELEISQRGIYAGAIGYVSASGSMDTCIALRTAVVKDGEMHVQAGAGIVADSNPQSEHEECENKARALFRAAQEAVNFASRRAN